MLQPKWTYNGTNGNPNSIPCLSYGMATEVSTNTKNIDVILEGKNMMGK